MKSMTKKKSSKSTGRRYESVAAMLHGEKCVEVAEKALAAKAPILFLRHTLLGAFSEDTRSGDPVRKSLRQVEDLIEAIEGLEKPLGPYKGGGRRKSPRRSMTAINVSLPGSTGTATSLATGGTSPGSTSPRMRLPTIGAIKGNAPTFTLGRGDPAVVPPY